MMTTLRLRFAWIFAILILAASPSISGAQAPPTEAEALDIATDAYIYGYPLVTMEMTRKVMTNVAQPSGKYAPIGQFANLRSYPGPTDKEVTAPNADTLYSLCWLDLVKEPFVVSIPDEGGRYFLMPMLSGWTDVFSVPGKRTTGTKAQKYVITGPEWRGTLPADLTEIKAPTSMVWILTRTYCTGTSEDYKAVHLIQDKYNIVPLSAYGKPYTPSAGKVDPSVDMKTPVRDQVNKMTAATYFHLLAELMKTNPPAEADAPFVAKMAKIGLIPGQSFDMAKLDPTTAEAIKASPKAGQEAITAHREQAGEQINGWTYSLRTGRYGTDYLQRAFITAFGLGANRPEDAVYPTSVVDVNGERLNGSKSYTIYFPPGQTPPAKAFWSLTIYDSAYFLVPNKLNRMTLSPRDALQYNPDGSLDLLIQHETPDETEQSNWLPAPEGDFVLMLRMYWPNEAVAAGAWEPPPVVLTRKAETSRSLSIDEVKAIDDVNKAFTVAYNKGDSAAIADFFSEDAEISDEGGEIVTGKAAIAKHFSKVFRDEPNATIGLTRDSIRFIGTDSARETGRTTITPADGSGPEFSRFQVIYVRKNGKWLQDVVEESTDDDLTIHERLMELEWMVGDWVDESPEAVIRTSCRWSEDKNYLLRDFTMHVAGKPASRGTQRIGWDPVKGQFKSWVFDDDGGHSEGEWTRTGKSEWTISATGTLADGQIVDATQIVTFVNKSIAKWKSIDRTIDGEAVPDLDEVTLVKSPPKPGMKAKLK